VRSRPSITAGASSIPSSPRIVGVMSRWPPVTVRAPAATLQGRRWLGGKVEPIDDATCELRTSDDNLDWLAMRIAMIGFDYEVHEPPELIEHLRGIAERIGRAVQA